MNLFKNFMLINYLNKNKIENYSEKELNGWYGVNIAEERESVKQE